MTATDHMEAVWQAARTGLDEQPTGGHNIAYEAVDRHVTQGRADVVSLRWLGKGGARLDITYGDIAPDMDTSTLDADVDVRDALDIDSFDFLNFVVALHGATGVDVPEHDYAKVRTVRSCASYVADAASRA